MQSGFAQHIGRGLYALHSIETADYPNNAVLEVQYRNGQALATVLKHKKMKGRNE